MTRRDIIIISVLINAALLTLLFSTAITTSEDLIKENPKIEEAISLKPHSKPEYSSQTPALNSMITSQSSPVDEIDQALKVKASKLAYLQKITEHYQEESTPATVVTTTTDKHPNTIKITIKRGDSLDRIAKANYTTVEAIIKENQLASTQLKIGETLYLPIPKKNTSTLSEKENNSPSNRKFYTIEANDNPWKIARKNQVKLSELLKLNNLNEEKARNLKVGDKLRIR